MLKSRIRRRTIETAQAAAMLSDIETSIAALKDEDLLDLADIFAREAPSPLTPMAAAEMAKRGLSL
ncbi:hypothetical protein VH567_07525 [Sphingomonas sp. 4RDLI-65]|uniref:hypothetical protein n=1 Tax=Sphingomonas sp. 4RDLI-65 TaxID=3111641 RepID=UPI003C29C134